ncbi:MAG: hypothetical protein KatS3mg085_707 [Candidatus Dojkabacteria bacterium]|nr:MAG: hypothetical protein KatS3mg085_707 [Candidatus Dojkabacteria bacterium]
MSNPNFLNENSTNSDTVNQYQNAQVTTNIPQEQQLQSTDQAKEAQAQVNEFSNASLENQVGGQSGEFSQSNLNSDVNNFNPSPIQNEYQSKDETQQNTNLEVNANNSQNNTEQSVDTQMDMQKSNLNTKLFDDNPADDIQIEKDAASDNSSELNIDSNMDQKLEANKNNQNLDNQNTQDQNADKDKEANAETINTDLAGQSKNANNSSDKINRYDKKWYKKTETNSSYEEKDFNTSKIKVLTKPGVVGFNQSNVVDENFLKELVNFYVTNPGRVLFDVNTGKNVSIVNRVANKNVKSTVVVFSPFESMQNDQTLKVSPGDNVTFFYYSNLFEKMIFFIKECRYFIFFDDSHHSTFNFLANLLEFISLYGATSKPVYLFGNSWNTKVTELIRSLNLSEDIKKYLYFINSFDDLKKGLIDYESKMSTNIIPKVFDKRVYGDERDYIIF